jgi:hypothetical protein
LAIEQGLHHLAVIGMDFLQPFLAMGVICSEVFIQRDAPHPAPGIRDVEGFLQSVVVPYPLIKMFEQEPQPRTVDRIIRCELA